MHSEAEVDLKRAGRTHPHKALRYEVLLLIFLIVVLGCRVFYTFYILTEFALRRASHYLVSASAYLDSYNMPQRCADVIVPINYTITVGMHHCKLPAD